MVGKIGIERQAVEEIQDSLKAIKKNLRVIEDYNRDGGRPAASNAAYGQRQSLGVWHANAMASMIEHYPEFADDISLRGGGDR